MKKIVSFKNYVISKMYAFMADEQGSVKGIALGVAAIVLVAFVMQLMIGPDGGIEQLWDMVTSWIKDWLAITKPVV